MPFFERATCNAYTNHGLTHIAMLFLGLNTRLVNSQCFVIERHAVNSLRKCAVLGLEHNFNQVARYKFSILLLEYHFTKLTTLVFLAKWQDLRTCVLFLGVNTLKL